MKKAIIISFYESSNIGDLELSSSIEKILLNKDYDITRFNFTSGIRFKKKENIKHLNKKRNTWKVLKLLTRLILGEVRYSILVWKLITSKRWEKNYTLDEDFKQTDIVVFAGGNMIMDIIPTWPYMIEKYITKANYFNKPFYFLYVGVGPLKYKNSIKILKKSLSNVNGISVRDEISQNIINEIVDIEKVTLTADPVFSNPIRYNNRKIKNKDFINIGICVLGEMCFIKKDEYFAYLENLELLIKKFGKSVNNSVKIILFSTEILDYKSIEYLHSKLMDFNYVTIIKVYNINDLYILYGQLNFLVGGRMHSMILAQKNLLPYIGIIWQKKIIGFSKLTNSENKMFTLISFKEQIDFIVNLILQNSRDEKVLLEMDITNIGLQKIIIDGDIVD